MPNPGDVVLTVVLELSWVVARRLRLHRVASDCGIVCSGPCRCRANALVDVRIVQLRSNRVEVGPSVSFHLAPRVGKSYRLPVAVVVRVSALPRSKTAKCDSIPWA